MNSENIQIDSNTNQINSNLISEEEIKNDDPYLPCKCLMVCKCKKLDQEFVNCLNSKDEEEEEQSIVTEIRDLKTPHYKSVTRAKSFYGHMYLESTQCTNISLDRYQLKAKTFAIVFGQEDLKIGDHMNLHLLILHLLVHQFLQNEFGITPKQVYAFHEHGSIQNKCQYIAIVEVEKEFRCSNAPFVFDMGNGKTMHATFQKAKNNFALKKYILSQSEVELLYKKKGIVLSFKDKEKKKVDVYKTIMENRELIDVDTAFELFMVHDPRTAIMSATKLKQNVAMFLSPPLPEFKFVYPEYLKGRFPVMENWFNEYCNVDNLKRRKALVIFSKQRELGKTWFAESLVNHPSYFVKFRNSFTFAPLNAKNPKLLILDDMMFMKEENIETWKALLAGQSTSIVDKYFNYQWDFNVPCIVTTNNFKLLNYLMTRDEFKTSVMIQCLDQYIGPEGSKPKLFGECIIDIPESLKNDILNGDKEYISNFRTYQENKNTHLQN
jgi:hypothetical protein